jgi:hypothetical protein
MKYFLLKNDLNYPKRWFLGPIALPSPFDFWKFTGIGPIEDETDDLQVKITESGSVLDFTFSDFDIPIINEKVASFFPEHEVQLIKVQAGLFTKLYILMILNALDCVDESLSSFEKFDENHSIRPDLAGNYEVFYKLVLDKSRCAEFSIFKIKGCSHYIIVNEKIKNKMMDSNVKGVLFQEV